MTCIVGLEHNGKVYLGGDSAASSGFSVTHRADEKVFLNGKLVMGFCGSFRMGQLLRYSFKAPKKKPKQSDMEYLVVDFMNEVRKCFKNGGILEKGQGAETGGSWLVGFNGQLYRIGKDFQVSISLNGYQAIGCGADLALGVMYATKSYDDPEDRIVLALHAASHHNGGVAPPFIVLST